MDWIQFFSLLSTTLAGFGFLYREMKDWKKEAQEEIKEQSKRTDKLYEMFIDLRRENDQKFYDLLRSQNYKTKL